VVFGLVTEAVLEVGDRILARRQHARDESSGADGAFRRVAAGMP
jgi:hypothetical protein